MKRLAWCGLALVAVSALQAAEPSMHSQDGRFKISPKRLASGGALSQGGDYRLSGSIGQPDASTRIGSGRITATLGLQARAIDPTRIFRDGFED